jgi:hypothetical protein
MCPDILGRIFFEYDGESHEYEYRFPGNTPKEMMELTLLGLLYEANWSQVEYEMIFEEV